MPSGVPPMPSRRSTPVSGRAAMIAPATSPSEMSLIRAPVARTSSMSSLVARPVEDDDGDVGRALVLGLGDAAMFSATGQRDVDDVGGVGAGDQLLHVEDGARVVHRAAVGDGHARRWRWSGRWPQPRAVDRVDRDVAVRAGAVTDVLAVEEHGRVVLLALADDDHAVHRHGADQGAHGVDGRAVGAVLVAAADPAAAGQRRRLGDADQLQRQVAVRLLGRRPDLRWNPVQPGVRRGLRLVSGVRHARLLAVGLPDVIEDPSCGLPWATAARVRP